MSKRKPAAPPGPTEKQFQAAVIKLARLLRWRVYHTHDSRRSAAGWPDLVLVRGPSLLFIELKVGVNRLTPAQADWLHALRGAGVPAGTWHPDDWPVIERILKEGPPR